MEANKVYHTVISFPVSLNIRNASDLHLSITEKFRDNISVVFEIPADAEADLSFVQLVESARIHAKASGKSLRLASPATGSVLKVLERGGFVEAMSAEDAQFWLHREV